MNKTGKKKQAFGAALALALLLPLAALAETRWTEVPETVRPGQNRQFSFESDAGSWSVSVTRADGSVSFINIGKETEGGTTAFWWNGQVNGEDLSEGEATLTVSAAGESDSRTVLIGAGAPVLSVLDAPEDLSDSWSAVVDCSAAGTLCMSVTVSGTETLITAAPVEAGETELFWDGRLDGLLLPTGEYTVTFRLTDADGITATPEALSVTMPKEAQPQPAHDAYDVYPNADSVMTCDHEVCYWKTACGDLDEETVWAILTQPVTVLKGGQREQVKVRAEPDADCKDYVGLVTCDSQAVHVLKTEGDWTMIEAYSSCQSESSIGAYATHITGWVKTSLLQEKQTSQKYGIVIDKLQQRLYLFVEGKLYSTLLCSTGFPGTENPWNETQAGEFLVVSWTGGFYSNDMYCDYALRINSGILLHEVPCYLKTREDGTTWKYYSVFPDYLGEKASHGCIRIQAKKTPEGVNAEWLWDHLEMNTKVIIWDEIGRELVPADDDYVLYYNPDGGRTYHSSATCSAVSEEYLPLTAFTWGQLEDSGFSKLTRCPACAPQLRASEVETVNSKNTRQVP